MERLEDGRPLREAMKSAGMSIPDLARATKAKDPNGDGVAQAYIGFLTAEPEKRSARSTCGPGTAQLIAAALDKDVAEFFKDPTPPSVVPEGTTATVES